MKKRHHGFHLFIIHCPIPAFLYYTRKHYSSSQLNLKPDLGPALRTVLRLLSISRRTSLNSFSRKMIVLEQDLMLDGLTVRKSKANPTEFRFLIAWMLSHTKPKTFPSRTYRPQIQSWAGYPDYRNQPNIQYPDILNIRYNIENGRISGPILHRILIKKK